MKTGIYIFRIFSLISLFIAVIYIVLVLFLTKASDNNFISPQTSYKKAAVDPAMIAAVKSVFPQGFPLPNDSDIIAAIKTAPKIIDGYTINGSYQISYTTSESVDEILAQYKTALEAQGLFTSTRPPDLGEQTITGNKMKKDDTGHEVADGTYEIGINIANLPDNLRRVNLWLNQ